jgi:hypothetical protein
VSHWCPAWEGFLKHVKMQILDPNPKFLIEQAGASPEMHISNKIPGHAGATYLGTF